MRVIRQAQLDALARASQATFENGLARQLGIAPAHVAAAVAAAQAQGLTRERDVVEHVERTLRDAKTPGSDVSTLVTQTYSNEPVGRTVQPCPLKPILHWVEIELLGEDDRPVPGERYRIELPGGRVINGQLDADGKAYVGEFPESGQCRISFPDLDRDAWEPLRAPAGRSS